MFNICLYVIACHDCFEKLCFSFSQKVLSQKCDFFLWTIPFLFIMFIISMHIYRNNCMWMCCICLLHAGRDVLPNNYPVATRASLNSPIEGENLHMSEFLKLYLLLFSFLVFRCLVRLKFSLYILYWIVFFCVNILLIWFYMIYRSKSRSVDHGFAPPFDLDSLRSKVEGRFDAVQKGIQIHSFIFIEMQYKEITIRILFFRWIWNC